MVILSELLAIIEVDTCRPIFDSNFLLMYIQNHMNEKGHDTLHMYWTNTWHVL